MTREAADKHKDSNKRGNLHKLKDKAMKVQSYVVHAQSLFAIAVVFHTLAISYFKATLVYILRFQCKLNENQAIVCYHLFQTSSYFTAFFFGIIMTYSPFIAIILMMALYFLGTGIIAFTLIEMPEIPESIPYIPLAIAVFGICVGTFKSTIPKVLSPQKSPDVFMGCIFVEMFLEVLFIGLGSMFLDGLEIYVILTLYSISVVIIIVASIKPIHDPKHLTEKTFKYVNVCKCTAYGLWRSIINFAKDIVRNNEHKETKDDTKHWLHSAEKKFGKDLVEALIIKFQLHKFYFWIAGVWIGVELKYSYWIFTAYLTDRTIGPLVIHPSQYLAIPPLLLYIAIPLFTLYLAPALSKSYYNNGTRQMCAGAGFILFATALSWQLSARLSEASTEFMEADFSHTRVRIINGHLCPSGILYYFPIDPEIAKVIHAKPAIETAFPVGSDGKPVIGPKKSIETMVNIITPRDSDTFLKYAKIPEEDEDKVGTIEKTTREPTDSFTYVKSTKKSYDNAVTVAAFGYCETLYTTTLDIPVELPRKGVGYMDVYLVHKGNGTQFTHFENIAHQRNSELKPGLRIYVVSDEPLKVELWRESEALAIIREEESQQPSKMIWLEPGDGANLEIRALNKTIRFRHNLRVAEVVDLLVYAKEKLAVKMLYAQPPFTISLLAPLPQYFCVSFGEFLLGVVGLQYMIRHAPPKMQYFVFMDWYLMLGCANIVIIVISQWPGLLVFHSQLSNLTLLVGMSYCFLMVMASRF